MNDKLKFEKKTSESISSLTKTLGLSQAQLDAAISLSEQKRYKAIPAIPKSDGTIRKVYKPDYRIRIIQQRINENIFKKIVYWPPYIFGSIPNEADADDTVIKRCYVACASKHCGSKSILKADITDFFNHIHKDHVFSIFRELLKINEDHSKFLTNICCYKDNLAQGALTSSYLACLCLWKLEPDLVIKLSRKGLRYTRLVDDITISSTVNNYSFNNTLHLLRSMLAETGLPLNETKTKTHFLSNEPLTVHGLRVNFKEPRLPSDEVRRLRAAVRNIEKLALSDSYRKSIDYRKDFNRCMGRVNKLKRVGHMQHEVLTKKLKAVLPLPSKRDLEIFNKKIKKLQKCESSQRSKYWYKREFNKLSNLLITIKRSYPDFEKKSRLKLAQIKPTL